MLKSRIIFFSLFLFVSCSVSNVTTQWTGPDRIKLKIVDPTKGIIFDSSLPALIELSNYLSAYNQGYFVELLTKDKLAIFGTLNIYEGTKLTELSNVKVEITDAIINKVLDNQVSQITVNDPSAQKLILKLTIGNKMPSEMKEAYKDLNISPF